MTAINIFQQQQNDRTRMVPFAVSLYDFERVQVCCWASRDHSFVSSLRMLYLNLSYFNKLLSLPQAYAYGI
jgi:hypothetical protein